VEPAQARDEIVESVVVAHPRRIVACQNRTTARPSDVVVSAAPLGGYRIDDATEP